MLTSQLGSAAKVPAEIAYFSMEVAIDPAIPTYSGGLGVLAGDALRAAADLSLPLVAVTLLYRKGYFRQHLDHKGHQTETPVDWKPEQLLTLMTARTRIQIEGRTVELAVWRYLLRGASGHDIPLYFLDADIPGNAPADRRITDVLYGGDEDLRLKQEAILGLGGVGILKALGLPPGLRGAAGLRVYHMNEGHASLLTLALLQSAEKTVNTAAPTHEDIEAVRELCVFTTHTPVPAGHDTFPATLASNTLGKGLMDKASAIGAVVDGRLHMTHLALRLSRFTNGVAKRHAEVSRRMFPDFPIAAITNGVHALTWTADAIRALFDQHIPGWRQENSLLRHACELPLTELHIAHVKAKEELLREIRLRTGTAFDPNIFTIGFARRAAEYKRATLLFHSPKALAALARQHPLQVVFAGKAHPRDFGGKDLIEKVFAGAEQAAASGIHVVYLEEYDMTLGRLLTSGVDLWLNTPAKPLEASGTSGMKAAINGVPSLSTLDGWWVEGCVEKVTGWEIHDGSDAFGKASDEGASRDEAARSLYALLGDVILPMFHQHPEAYTEIMRNCIFVNGSYFNTHRMVLQYVVQAYNRVV